MQQLEHELTLDAKGNAVHFTDIVRLIQFFPTGEKHRTAIVFLAATGARVSEIENLSPGSFWLDKTTKKLHCIWKPRKIQKGIRNEALPDWVTYELEQYFRHGFEGRGWDDRLFPFTGDGLGQYVDKHARPALGGDFLKKVPGCRKGAVTDAMLIQLKGLRKTFASTLFWNLSRTYGAEMGVHMVSLRMLHSSAYMTCRHYANNIQYLKDELDQYPGKSAAEIIGIMLGYGDNFKYKPEAIRHKDQRPFAFSLQDCHEGSLPMANSLPMPESMEPEYSYSFTF